MTLKDYQEVALVDEEAHGLVVETVDKRKPDEKKKFLWAAAMVSAVLLAGGVGFLGGRGSKQDPNQIQENNVDFETTIESSMQELVSTTVRIPHIVEPNDEFITGMRRDARQFFPAEDIFIKAITFVGVEVDSDSELIPFHKDAYEDETETHIRDDVLYAHHHTIIHQGRQDWLTDSKRLTDSKNKKIQELNDEVKFTVDKAFFHENPAIAFGTHPHTTSYGDYGLRLRKDTEIFHCQHSLNRSDETKTFTTIWKIHYLPIDDTMSANETTGSGLKPTDVRPLVAVWFHGFLPSGAKLNEHHTITKRVTFSKEVNLTGIIYHHHPWATGIQAFDKNENLVWEHDGTPSDDGTIDFLPQPLNIATSDHIEFVAQGKATFEGDLNTPLALTMFLNPQDGSDRVESKEELKLLAQVQTNVD